MTANLIGNALERMRTAKQALAEHLEKANGLKTVEESAAYDATLTRLKWESELAVGVFAILAAEEFEAGRLVPAEEGA